MSETRTRNDGHVYAGSEDPHEVLNWGFERFGNQVALASSFSIEDIVVMHMMKTLRADARVFALDTGRLNEETYECAERVSRKLDMKIEWFFPKSEAVETLIRNRGLLSFRDSLENRKECCGIRKVEPLGRALAGLDAWVTGIRRAQSVTRADIPPVETDAAHGGMAKLNPLVGWSENQVWDYIKTHKLPYNRLHDMGYPSIGCAPCTRAVQAGEDPRAGRWWWENPDHKECGLHLNERPEAHRGGNI